MKTVPLALEITQEKSKIDLSAETRKYTKRAHNLRPAVNLLNKFREVM